MDKLTGFWATVLVSHERLSELISEDDEEALQSLSHIEVHEFDDIKSGYKIDFVSLFHRFVSCIHSVYLQSFAVTGMFLWLSGITTTVIVLR